VNVGSAFAYRPARCAEPPAAARGHRRQIKVTSVGPRASGSASAAAHAARRPHQPAPHSIRDASRVQYTTCRRSLS
jgi:hypothetical protein